MILEKTSVKDLEELLNDPYFITYNVTGPGPLSNQYLSGKGRWQITGYFTKPKSK